MPFSTIFHKEEQCKEHRCKVDRSNIVSLFKPDKGFLDKAIEQKLFPDSNYKICDCILSCSNGNITLVEILCGTLTTRELKEKTEQLKNCYCVVNHISLSDNITKIILQVDRLESSRKQPQLRKKLSNTRIGSKPLILAQTRILNGAC